MCGVMVAGVVHKQTSGGLDCPSDKGRRGVGGARRSRRRVGGVPQNASTAADALSSLSAAKWGDAEDEMAPYVAFAQLALAMRLDQELVGQLLFEGPSFVGETGELASDALAWSVLDDEAWVAGLGEATGAASDAGAVITAAEVERYNLVRPLATVADAPVPVWRTRIALDLWNSSGSERDDKVRSQKRVPPSTHSQYVA